MRDPAHAAAEIEDGRALRYLASDELGLPSRTVRTPSDLVGTVAAPEPSSRDNCVSTLKAGTAFSTMAMS